MRLLCLCCMSEQERSRAKIPYDARRFARSGASANCRAQRDERTTGPLWPNAAPSSGILALFSLNPTLHAKGFLQSDVVLHKFLDSVSEANAASCRLYCYSPGNLLGTVSRPLLCSVEGDDPQRPIE